MDIHSLIIQVMDMVAMHNLPILVGGMLQGDNVFDIVKKFILDVIIDDIH